MNNPTKSTIRPRASPNPVSTNSQYNSDDAQLPGSKTTTNATSKTTPKKWAPPSNKTRHSMAFELFFDRLLNHRSKRFIRLCRRLILRNFRLSALCCLRHSFFVRCLSWFGGGASAKTDKDVIQIRLPMIVIQRKILCNI